MTEYRHTRIKQIVDCLRSCWKDIYEICKDWSTTAENLPEEVYLIANEVYLGSELNRNARRLRDLTSSPDLQSEVQQGQYSIEMMQTAMSEIERIEGWIDSWFATGFSSEDKIKDWFLQHDINVNIRYALFNVKWVFDPYLKKSFESSKHKNVDLSHNQIAILYHTAGWVINKNNADDIAQKHGQTSGQKLEAIYKELTSELVRTGKSKNRVNDYLAIELLVPESRKVQYNKELAAAKANNGK